ncbi:P2X purinoceptor 7-like [Argopecten irradians]|uniref:P2X purinoceptor 7-like n=1 Tax=Argopecten irradians TaxID=31199 RepID=UPI00371B3B3C
MEAKVDSLDETQMRGLLKKLVNKCPSLAFDLFEDKDGGDGGGYHPEGGTSPDWCSCGNCRQMPTLVERVCCNHQPQNCITILPYFDVLVMDDAVLALARLYREDVFALPGDVDLNRANRHTAYRQYVLWQFGRLGAGIRKVVPSCAVWKIRDKFPNAFGQYTGFKPSRLA